MNWTLIALRALADAQFGEDGQKLTFVEHKLGLMMEMSCEPSDGALANRFMAANMQFVWARLGTNVWSVELRGVGNLYDDARNDYKLLCQKCGYDSFFVTSVIKRHTKIHRSIDEDMMFTSEGKADADHIIKCGCCGDGRLG